MTAKQHHILTIVGLLLTSGATIVSALATQGVLAPTLAATIGSALTALVTVIREINDPSGTVPPTTPIFMPPQEPPSSPAQ